MSDNTKQQAATGPDAKVSTPESIELGLNAEFVGKVAWADARTTKTGKPVHLYRLEGGGDTMFGSLFPNGDRDIFPVGTFVRAEVTVNQGDSATFINFTSMVRVEVTVDVRVI